MFKNYANFWKLPFSVESYGVSSLYTCLHTNWYWFALWLNWPQPPSGGIYQNRDFHMGSCIIIRTEMYVISKFSKICGFWAKFSQDLIFWCIYLDVLLLNWTGIIGGINDLSWFIMIYLAFFEYIRVEINTKLSKESKLYLCNVGERFRCGRTLVPYVRHCRIEAFCFNLTILKISSFDVGLSVRSCLTYG